MFKGIKTLNHLLRRANQGIVKKELNINMPQSLITILTSLQNKGKMGLIVGGAVRDAILGIEPKDIDVEVYNISYDDLAKVLEPFGKLDFVGKSFGILKLVDKEGNDFDFSIPRRDSKVEDNNNGRGRGFESTFDTDITPKEAASRRDFTINSLGYNPLTSEVYDFFGGLDDLETKTLRATSPAFSEDALRVLRGMQFAARFDLTLDPETAQMASTLKDSQLTKERITGEWMKLFEKGKHPSKVIQFLIDTQWIDKYPELKAIVDLPQEPEWHPEGTVDKHTGFSMDAAAILADQNNISGEDKAVLIMAALTHDFGKATTTKNDIKDGIPRVTSHGHEVESGKLAQTFLESIGIKKDLIAKVVPLAAHHMVHLTFDPKSKKQNIRQIAEMLFPATIEQLQYVIQSDMGGRPPLSNELPNSVKDMIELSKKEDVYNKKITPLITGQELMDNFPIKQGKLIGEALKYVYNLQLQGIVKNKTDAFMEVDKFLKNNLLLLNGNDLISISGKPAGAWIKPILNQVWEAQKNNELKTKDEALNWILPYLSEENEIDSVSSLEENITEEVK